MATPKRREDSPTRTGAWARTSSPVQYSVGSTCKHKKGRGCGNADLAVLHSRDAERGVGRRACGWDLGLVCHIDRPVESRSWANGNILEAGLADLLKCGEWWTMDDRVIRSRDDFGGTDTVSRASMGWHGRMGGLFEALACMFLLGWRGSQTHTHTLQTRDPCAGPLWSSWGNRRQSRGRAWLHDDNKVGMRRGSVDGIMECL
jgi:hypothetical protein